MGCHFLLQGIFLTRGSNPSLLHVLYCRWNFSTEPPEAWELYATLVAQSLFVTPWTVTQKAPLSMGILQARILEWLPYPSPGELPNPGIGSRSPALWADSLLSEPPGKPKNTGVGNLSLLHGIFLTQESNRSHLHNRQILYQLSYQGSPPFKNHTPWRNLQMTWDKGFLFSEYFPHLLCSNIESISSALDSKMGILHPRK